jgi:alkylation response protein AidB-like acyl-CoA dehydrogenase
MSFDLTQEQEMIRRTVRDFAREKLAPQASKRDQDAHFPRSLIGEMGSLGLLGMAVPASCGGSNADAISYVLAVEEIASACASAAVIMSVCNLSAEAILRFGTEKQKCQYLTPLAAGEFIGAFAVTESLAGSDPGSMTSWARAEGDRFFLNGAKIFITNGSLADYLVLVVRAGESRAGRIFSAFIVEKSLPGFTIGPREEKMGLRASDTVELFFDESPLSRENLLGKEGQGFKIAMVALDSGRIGIAAQSLGIARACLEESIEWAKQRRQFGKTLASFQAIQWMIADMATELAAARLLTLAAADRKDRGLPFTTEASMAKLFASETANRAAYQAVQIQGGYGYMKESKVERLYRDARVTTIYEGTSEIQRLVIARNHLAMTGHPTSKE